MGRKFSFVTGALLFCTIANSQQHFPPKGEVFDDTVLPSVYVVIEQDSLDELLDYDNRLSDHHYPATFVFDNGTIRDTIDNIGFRLRGNTSRKAAKKSFKISFNEYSGGQKFYGLEKMNLNGEHNDPSIIRSKICFDMLDYLRVPASRTNHVKLYLNGVYFGIYLNVEHIDEEFTQSRYGGKGNLYKCTYGANLAYIGANKLNYAKSYYELKQPLSPTGYEDLAHFIDVLNNTPSSSFECELEKVFNVNSYLKSVVLDVLSGNWDGPNYNMNNFYLYLNPNTKQFEYIPYDLDNTFGVDFLGRDWSTRNVYNWSKGSNGRPLFDKILDNSTFKARYTYLLGKTIKEYFSVAKLSPHVYALKTLISQAAIEDTFRTKDYNYTVSDFNNSFGYFSKDHVKYGLIDFITRRATYASTQLEDIENVGVTAFAYDTHIDYENDSVTFSLIAKSEHKSKPIRLQYNWDSQSAVWYDTMNLVNEENDLYSLTIAWPDQFKTLAFIFEMQDELGEKTNYPTCNMLLIEKQDFDIGLYINEVLADNATGIQDEEGKNEDWIELFYNGSTKINLKGYYLTDDITNPYKYALPDITLESGKFTLIWADGDEQDGVNHANFKLSKDGEDLALFNKEGVLVDLVSFGSQSVDVSYGRRTDGAADWTYFETTTPNSPNDGTIGIPESEKLEILVYPNPTNGIISIVCPNPYTYTLYSSDAQLILTGSNQGSLNLKDFPDGLYVLQLLSDGQLSFKKIVLLR